MKGEPWHCIIMRHHSNANLIHVHMQVKHTMNTNVCLICFEIESNSETLHLDENCRSEQCYLFSALINSNRQTDGAYLIPNPLLG